MNKKGFTLVEIIVSISLVSIVVIFLFQLITTIKNIYDSQSNRNDTKITVAVITREVEKDLSSFGLESMPTKTCDMTNNNIVPSAATKVQCVKFIYKEENVKFNEGYVVYYENNGKYFLGYKRGKDNIIETQTVREINVAPVDDVSLEIKYKNANDIYSLKVNIPVRDNNDKYDLVINYIDSENSKNNDVVNLVSHIDNLYVESKNSNGLMVDNTADKNIRYVGANPKNYIYFNEELWRIIGIFNVYNTVTKQYERMVKIVRNDYLGNYSWDTSPEDINGGLGINEWSQADLMTELNTDYLDTSKTSGITYWYNDVKDSKDSRFFYEDSIKSSFLDKIASVRWNLGAATSNKISALSMYNAERGTTHVTNPSDGMIRTNTWDGKIGLIYPSDYGYASTNEACRNNIGNGDCNNDNWLSTSNKWTLTSYTTSPSGVFMSSVNGFIGFYTNEAATRTAIHPTLFLNSNVIISGGTGELEKPYLMIDYNAFRDDSWETIANNLKVGRTSIYHVGSTKQVSINGKNYTLRLANNSTPSECNDSTFSQTACGFVVEFLSLIELKSMNSTATSVGGWKDSEMRSYVNGELLNAFPKELKNVIVDTKVISGHGSTEGEENFETIDKLYMLSPKEIWGVNGGTAYNKMRQLDYYAVKNVTNSSNYELAIKKYNNVGTHWWLRDAGPAENNYFFYVHNTGKWYRYLSSTVIGVSPAFRIG